jgi:DsbE subfamily thiol:disulfide oxidoreductase
MRRLLFLLPLFLVMLLCGAFFGQIFRMTRGTLPNDIPTVLIDRAAPVFDLPSPLQGQSGPSSDSLKGKVVLVNFFASWCVPCRSEHRLLGALASEVTLVGLVYRDTPEAIRHYLDQLGDPYQAVGMVGSGSQTAIDFGLTGVPESYLIDRQGRIRYAWKKPFTAEEIATKLTPMIRELSK